MEEKNTSCCFTGHRITKLPWGANESDERCEALIAEIEEKLLELYRAGYRHFICGMALGCDTYFAQAVLRLREEHPEVTLEAAIPCKNQNRGWNKGQKERYYRLIDSCDRVTVLQEDYTPECMMKRNMYMVDKSSVLMACFSGRSGGTLNTMRYALKMGLELVTIDI